MVGGANGNLPEQGKTAELKWDASREAGVIGYHVYRLIGTWEIERATDQPLRQPAFREAAGSGVGRYWVVAVERRSLTRSFARYSQNPGDDLLLKREGIQ